MEQTRLSSELLSAYHRAACIRSGFRIRIRIRININSERGGRPNALEERHCALEDPAHALFVRHALWTLRSCPGLLSSGHLNVTLSFYSGRGWKDKRLGSSAVEFSKHGMGIQIRLKTQEPAAARWEVSIYSIVY